MRSSDAGARFLVGTGQSLRRVSQPIDSTPKEVVLSTRSGLDACPLPEIPDGGLMSLRVKAFSGGKWLSSSTVGVVALNFIQTAVLSRLLTPRDFGLTTMIWVFLGFAQMAADMGMTNAVIQRREITRDELSSVYWATAIVGLIIALAVWLSGPALAAYYREPEIMGLVPWVTVSFLVTALGQQFQTLHLRELRFGSLAIADVLAALASLAVAVPAALSGAGAYSLVFGGLASSLLRSVWMACFGWSQWHPHFHFRLRDLHGFGRYGAVQMGDRVANYVWNNVDYLLAGRYLGSGPLGIYRLAFETVVRPLATVGPIMNRICIPIFSKAQDDDARLRTGIVEVVKLVAVVVFPMLAGLFAVAPLAVSVIFGSKWAGAAWIMRILCPYGALRSLLNLATLLVLAKGRFEKALYLNLTLAVVLSAGYRLAVPYGLAPLAWTGLIVLALVTVVSWRGLYQTTVGLQASAYLGAIARPTLFSVVMACAVYAASHVVALFLRVAVLRLAVLIGFGAGLYVALLLIFDRAYVGQFVGYLRRPRS